MKFDSRLLIAVSVLTIPAGFLSTPFPYVVVFNHGISPATFDLYLAIVGVAAFVFNPVLLFVITFLLGKSVDLAADYLGAFGSILVGSLAGTFLGGLAGSTIFAFLVLSQSGSDPLLLIVLGAAVSSFRVWMTSTFPAFTAVTLAYFWAGPVKLHAQTGPPST